MRRAWSGAGRSSGVVLIGGVHGHSTPSVAAGDREFLRDRGQTVVVGPHVCARTLRSDRTESHPSNILGQLAHQANR